MEVEKEASGYDKFINSKSANYFTLAVYLFLGTIFYCYYDSMGWAKGYYYAVSTGLRVGFVTPDHSNDRWSIFFSIIYILFGFYITALLAFNTYKGNYVRTKDQRKKRMLLSLFSVTCWIIIGVAFCQIWTEQNLTHSIYFSVSNMWAWGVHGVKIQTTSNTEYILIATYTVIGVVQVVFLNALIYSEIEVYVEELMLRRVTEIPMKEYEFRALQQLIRNDNRDELTELEVKLFVIGRLKNQDLSIPYFQIRAVLPLVFLFLVAIGGLFWGYYNHAGDASFAINYALSSGYRLGMSSDDTDIFSIYFSIIYMMVFTFVFSALFVTTLREFSLYVSRVRRTHTIVMGTMTTLLFIGAAIWMYFTLTEDQQEFDDSPAGSLYLAFSLMVGLGWQFNSFPGNYGVWELLIMDVYIFVIHPLFAIFIAHLAAEIDVGDQRHYMLRAVRTLFNAEDKHLLRIFDEQWNPKVHGYGIRELHVLLMIRMQEPYAMDPIINKVLDGFDNLAGIRRVSSNENLHGSVGIDDDGETERRSFFTNTSSSSDGEAGGGGDALPSHSPAARRYTSSRRASNRLQGSSRRNSRTLAPRRWHFSSHFPFIYRDEDRGDYNSGSSGSGSGQSRSGQSYYGSFFEVSERDNGSSRNEEIDPFLVVDNEDY